MRAPDWYEAWCDEAFDAFMAKQKQASDTYRLGEWARYDYDTDAGVLTFSDDSGPRVIADIQVLGTTAPSDWLWGWANAIWPPASVADAARVRDFGAEHGIEELTTESLVSDDLDGLGWMLAAIATRVLDAEGAYRAPTQNGGLYLIMRTLRSVS